ncbi:MAG: hypothetical protein A2W93_13320 [Bacteroidetes bacterium GWF2_43_63]|nr:MAG: hypothetical protein A2W94_03290 [Bacteroidetes bacterium GWE2_42_42]OFY55161.1 MAG: hypothetical protein A2W93_13320 [Bacteroidetes bacterium GWF2_43_63]HBG70217.1 hypothetical protein [Bacteroidales bacterium]HCB63110.1 hypothetical protein [Bacteroidales bacterium]HCY22671.1 hypothetical protein [Bacteroidales bacterium]
MINQNDILKLSDSLKPILDRELEKGNEILETSNGWPCENSIIIFLKKPFILTHKNESVEYRELNDPHYWKAEYYDKNNKHILACRF